MATNKISHNKEFLNIIDFLKTGSIETLRLGVSIDEFYERKLDSSLIYDNNNSLLFYVGIIEIIFYKGLLTNITISRDAINSCCININEERIFFNRKMSIIRLTRLLNKACIGWEFSKEYTFDKSIAIATEGDVYILLDFENDYEIQKIAI